LNPDCIHPENGVTSDFPKSIPSVGESALPTLKTPVDDVPGIVGLLAIPKIVNLLVGVVVPIPTFCAILVIVMAKKPKIANAFFMIDSLFIYKKNIHFL
jgi:hypothetical protein